MSNADLRALSKYLHEGIGTPVLIVDSEQIIEPASFPDYGAASRDRMVFLTEYLQHQSAFADVLHAWVGAWESREMTNYRRHYDTAAFSGQGLEWDGWRRRKQRTFDAYDTIAVSFEDLLVTEYSESTATVKFIQHYRSDLLDVTNGKKLDFVRRDDTWLITNESTFPQEELL
jgi:predicted ester cyclase